MSKPAPVTIPIHSAGDYKSWTSLSKQSSLDSTVTISNVLAKHTTYVEETSSDGLDEYSECGQSASRRVAAAEMAGYATLNEDYDEGSLDSRLGLAGSFNASVNLGTSVSTEDQISMAAFSLRSSSPSCTSMAPLEHRSRNSGRPGSMEAGDGVASPPPSEDRIVGHQYGVKPLLDDDELSGNEMPIMHNSYLEGARMASVQSLHSNASEATLSPPPPVHMSATAAVDVDPFGAAPFRLRAERRRRPHKNRSGERSKNEGGLAVPDATRMEHLVSFLLVTVPQLF